MHSNQLDDGMSFWAFLVLYDAYSVCPFVCFFYQGLQQKTHAGLSFTAAPSPGQFFL